MPVMTLLTTRLFAHLYFSVPLEHPDARVEQIRSIPKTHGRSSKSTSIRHCQRRLCPVKHLLVSH
jgi:hypothetical protein